MSLVQPMIKKNDKLASKLISIFSFVVFAAVILLGRVKIEVDLGFDVHVFAFINACINATVAFTLVAALVSVKIRRYSWHRNLMMTALLK